MLDSNVLSDIGNERAGWQRIVGKIIYCATKTFRATRSPKPKR